MDLNANVFWQILLMKILFVGLYDNVIHRIKLNIFLSDWINKF